MPELTEIREGPAVARVRGALGHEMWLVTRHEDVREVLGDAERFSNGSQTVFPGRDRYSPEDLARMRAGNLLLPDPPEHSRLRRMLMPAFTGRRMQRLEPRVRQIVDDHLDAMARKGPPADLVADFAMPPCRRW